MIRNAIADTFFTQIFSESNLEKNGILLEYLTPPPLVVHTLCGIKPSDISEGKRMEYDTYCRHDEYVLEEVFFKDSLLDNVHLG